MRPRLTRALEILSKLADGAGGFERRQQVSQRSSGPQESRKLDSGPADSAAELSKAVSCSSDRSVSADRVIEGCRRS